MNDILRRGLQVAAETALVELAKIHGVVLRVEWEEHYTSLQAKLIFVDDERADIETSHAEAMDMDSEVSETGWLFYVQRSVAVMCGGTYGEAKEAQRVIGARLLDEEYVDWFKGIPTVDRALMTEDPPELLAFGAVEDY